MTDLKQLFEHNLLEEAQIAFDLNHFLANNPELSGSEFLAIKEISGILAKHKIPSEKNFVSLPTAFKANIVKGDEKAPRFAILMEYDALPHIGHGNGHCASGSISLLAALALRKMRADLNAHIDLIGTPNEEVRGDKIIMANEGIFNSYDAVVMVQMSSNQTLPYCHFLALSEIKATFTGKEAHAATAPWQGRNALNASILTCNAIDMLRQQLEPANRVAYTINQSGQATNLIPDHSEVIINLRHPYKAELDETMHRIHKCIEGASIATETNFKIEKTGEDFADIKLNRAGIDVITDILNELDIPSSSPNVKEEFGSSDIGNISYITPTFQPLLAITDEYIPINTREFAELMKSDSINHTIKNGAKIIGHFIIELASNLEKLSEMKKEFEERVLY